jgi:hypothetical protein
MMSGPPSRTNTLDELEPPGLGRTRVQFTFGHHMPSFEPWRPSNVAGTEEAMNIEIKRCFT